MFNLGETLMGSLITGAMNKQFSREWAIVTAVDYLYKGVLSDGQVRRIVEAITPASVNG